VCLLRGTDCLLCVVQVATPWVVDCAKRTTVLALSSGCAPLEDIRRLAAKAVCLFGTVVPAYSSVRCHKLE
jgi:hypothetical protein